MYMGIYLQSYYNDLLKCIETTNDENIDDNIKKFLDDYATILANLSFVGLLDTENDDGHARVLPMKGQPRITADGVVVFDGAKVWPREDFWIYKDEANENWTPEDESGVIRTSIIESSGEHIPPSEVNVSVLYSSPEAASKSPKTEESNLMSAGVFYVPVEKVNYNPENKMSDSVEKLYKFYEGNVNDEL